LCCRYFIKDNEPAPCIEKISVEKDRLLNNIEYTAASEFTADVPQMPQYSTNISGLSFLDNKKIYVLTIKSIKDLYIDKYGKNYKYNKTSVKRAGIAP